MSIDSVENIPSGMRDTYAPKSFSGIDSAVDLHSQTTFSDGQQNIHEFLEEAYGNVYLKGISDHGNVGEEPKKYSSSFYSEYFDEGDRGFTETPDNADIPIYQQRYETLKEALDDYDKVVLWEDIKYDQEEVEKVFWDLEAIRNESAMKNGLHYDMVVMHGFEPDYNPPIALASNEEEERAIVESYNQRIVDFLLEAEQRGAGFDYINAAVHDVNVPDLRYLKIDDLFENFSREQKMDVWNQYRRKQFYLMDTLAPALDEIDVMVMGAHPALPERNSELMEVWEQGTWESRDDLLKDYWKPLADMANNAVNYIPEVNGKHTRFMGIEEEDEPPYEDEPVVWRMFDEYIPGTDHHREGEQPDRSRNIAGLDLPGDVRTPVDLWIEKLLEGEQERAAGVEAE